MDRAAQLQAHVDDLEGQTNEAQAHARELESSLRATEQRASEVDARARDIEQRAKDAAERIVDAERRARDSQNQLAEMTQMLQAAEAQIGEARTQSAGSAAGLERQLAAAQTRIGELKREVDAAENVRQFAANTEREIAQLERDLRDHKAKVTQLTLERDRLESQLRDLRDDSETTHRKVPSLTEEAPSQHARYTQLVSRASELEQKNGKLEKDLAGLRRQLAETELRADAQARAHEDEPTNTGNALPLEFAEHLNVLEESIDSLRANMRAASDETAMMDQTESVIAVASAVSQAAEHVERARDSLRLLNGLVAKH
jgi:chromosome segregation ATPase